MDNYQEGFWSKKWVLFFLAPLIFLIIVRLIGYQIFYGQATYRKRNPRQAFLLAGGALFYLVLLIVLVAFADRL